jgi:glycosyltransferase involved in cell wall biosynthesis
VPNVLIVRGHLVTPWELRPWRELPQRFDVSYLLTPSNGFTPPEGLRATRVRTLRDLLPQGPVGEVAAGVLGDRYLSAERAFAEADIVHAEELAFWFAAEAARRKRRHGFKLVQTIWETLPLLSAFRNRHARRNRELVLAETDLFLPATSRAADALRLEGVEEERICVCPPGIDVERFSGAAQKEGTTIAQGLTRAGGPTAHTIVSPGRLVWEKGHQDVLRALAALHRGIVTLVDGSLAEPRLKIIGSGPEEHRLRAYTAELGLAESVEIGGVPYDRMPAVFASASAMVLASQASASAAYHLFDIPRAFWEEQFGLVLAEAMAAGLAIVTTTSGAIPEVLAGVTADLVAPGDWLAMARPPGAWRPPTTRYSHSEDDTSAARGARRPEPHLPRPGRDRWDGGVRPRADTGAAVGGAQQDALHGVRQPRGRGGGRRSVGRAAAGGDRSGQRAQPRAVGARRADAVAGDGRPRAGRSRAQLRLDGAAVGTLSPCDHGA